MSVSKNGEHKSITSIADLKPDTKNANKGSQRGRGLLEKSLRRYGAGRSVVVDRDGEIIAGNKTIDVAAELDLPVKVVQTNGEEVVVVQRTDLDIDSEAGRGLAIADNRTGEVSLEWDTDALLDLSDKVDLTEFWKPDELDKLVKGWRDIPKEDYVPSIDKANELRKKWGVELGQLWQLGEHRIICGDCTDADVVARLMDGEKVDALLTDPPYGIDLNTDWSAIGGTNSSLGFKNNIRGKKYTPVYGDQQPFNPVPMLELWADGVKEVFLFGADYYAEHLVNRNDGSWLVWDKRKESQADGFGSEFELIWSKKKHKRRILRHQWYGFLRDGEHNEVRTHPTQKSIVLIKDIIKQWCTGQIIADPYLGSGTTLIACERLGRKCRAVDIEPKYIAVTLERWATYTGQQPELI